MLLITNVTILLAATSHVYVHYKYMARDEKNRFDWDQDNIGHVAKHKVTPEEVEQVLSNDPLFIETRIDLRSGEERILELGHTNAGRVLFVAWMVRDGFVRPITAYPANRKTRADYYKRKIDEKT